MPTNVVATRRMPCRVVLLALMLVGMLVDVSASYDCNPKYCSQMRDCAEAWHHYRVCKEIERDGDGDGDGIPCENVCGVTREKMALRLRAAGVEPDAGSKPPAFLTDPAPAYSCVIRKTCRAMASCDEAVFHLERCGNRRLDGDGDGVPCNDLCRGR